MSFRLKITLCMMWLIAVIFGIGNGVILSLSFSRTMESQIDSISATFRMTTQTLRLIYAAGAEDEVNEIRKTLSSLDRSKVWSAVRLTVDDKTTYESGSIVRTVQSLSRDPAHYQTNLFHTEDGRTYLQVSGMLKTERELLTLDIAEDITSIYETQQQQLQLSRRLFVLLMLGGGLAVWSISWLLTRPLRSLSRASRELAKGNLGYRTRVKSRDEVGALAGDFNRMAEKLDENLTELQEAVERQERFMGSFAHEMKTPMTSIIGYADLLRSDALDKSEQMEAANYIFSEGKRLESLSLKLLDILVAKKKNITLQTVRPKELIQNLTDQVSRILCSRGITIDCHGQEGVCKMEPDLIKSVLINLIDNARKAMDNGGHIHIEWSMTQEGCSIKVIDNGRGIPPEALGHLTEAFFRVDKSRSRAQGGVGLGLALCGEIVEMHHGQLLFESKEGEGTCVTVLLKGGRA